MRVSIWPGATALADQGGGYGEVRHSSHVGAGDPAAHVDHDTASERDDHVAPADLCPREPVEELDRLLHGLVALSGGHRGHLRLDAGPLQCTDHDGSVEPGHGVVGDQRHLRIADQLEQPLHGVLRRARHDDRIRVNPLRAALGGAADRRQLDGVERVDEVATQQLGGHAASVGAGGRGEDHPIG
jgi:hypothetical protein